MKSPYERQRKSGMYINLHFWMFGVDDLYGLIWYESIGCDECVCVCVWANGESTTLSQIQWDRNSAECSVFVPGRRMSEPGFYIFFTDRFDECSVFAICVLSAIFTARTGQLCHCLLVCLFLASPCLLVMGVGVGIPPVFFRPLCVKSCRSPEVMRRRSELDSFWFIYNWYGF